MWKTPQRTGKGKMARSIWRQWQESNKDISWLSLTKFTLTNKLPMPHFIFNYAVKGFSLDEGIYSRMSKWETYWLLTKWYVIATTLHNLLLENSSWGLLVFDLDLEGLGYSWKDGEERWSHSSHRNIMSRTMEIGPSKDERPNLTGVLAPWGIIVSVKTRNVVWSPYMVCLNLILKYWISLLK